MHWNMWGIVLVALVVCVGATNVINFMDGIKDDAGTKYSGGLNWPIAPLKQSMFLHRYGYYECRCRLQRKEGWWSAFWIQSPIIGASLDPAQTGVEVDIMESFHPGKVIGHAVIWDGYGCQYKGKKYGNGSDEMDLDEFHTFGVEWNENGYTFYMDGVEDGHCDAPVSHCPQFILVGPEVNGYRKESMCHTEESARNVGDTFVVDYVRVFDAVK